MKWRNLFQTNYARREQTVRRNCSQIIRKVRDIKEMKIAIRKLAIVMEGFQTKLDILLYTIGA
jgi:hypothetical protein